jgi:hypothetical protein
VDFGTHAELLQRCSLYRDFAEEQRIERELSSLNERASVPLQAVST